MNKKLVFFLSSIITLFFGLAMILIGIFDIDHKAIFALGTVFTIIGLSLFIMFLAFYSY